VSLLIWLTGASGAGKTAVLAALRPLLAEERATLVHFDSVGVPPPERMPADWQEVTTRHWVERAAQAQAPVFVVDGQSRLAFVLSAARAYPHLRLMPVLVCCDDAERHRRLRDERRQPELVNPQMDNWAAYLRREAEDAGAVILDTTRRLAAECAAELALHIGR
jgi:hypothetical protein